MRGLLDNDEAARERRNYWLKIGGYVVGGIAVIALVVFLFPGIDHHNGDGDNGHGGHSGHGKHDKCSKPPAFNESMCAQPAVLAPAAAGFAPAKDLFFTEKYKKHSVDVWGGAVRIPTESFDDFGNVNEDPRFNIFYDFAEYLEKAFPRVHKHAALEKVNTHGLLYTLEGSDKDLKPLVLMAHQDVVPVLPDTLDKWTYPPFSAHFDGEFLWGRGSSDCKNQLTSVLQSVEALLAQGFKPHRTILLSFGFDEEVSGPQGASHLAKRIEELYGKDSVFMVVDEGAGLGDYYGTTFALPAVAEKGYIDAFITLNTPGGHSSIPPPHTAIGVISEVVTLLEANPFKGDITPRNPFYHFLKCAAGYAADIDDGMKSDILLVDQCTPAKERVLDRLDEEGGLAKFVLQTSQAADIISGGLKINALPEKVTVQVNHRIAVESTTDDIKKRVAHYVTKVAKKHGFSVEAWGEAVHDGDVSKGFFNITGPDSLNPAPVTPISGPAWDILGGTTRHVFQEVVPSSHGKDIVFAPGIMTGNTDTKFYWNLTRNIFRYGPVHESQSFNAHTVDERVHIDAHLGLIAFFYELILNVDAYKGN